MKQIFDDIRKEIDIHSDKACFMPDDMEVIAESRLKQILDEAEAKWEADCCEWKFNEFEEQWETSCGVLLNPNSNDREATFYCCHCGKPIKILEVE